MTDENLYMTVDEQRDAIARSRVYVRSSNSDQGRARTDLQQRLSEEVMSGQCSDSRAKARHPSHFLHSRALLF